MEIIEIYTFPGGEYNGANLQNPYIFLKEIQRQIHPRRQAFESFGGSGMKALNIEQEDTSPGIRDLQESAPRVITFWRHVGRPRIGGTKHYYFFGSPQISDPRPRPPVERLCAAPWFLGPGETISPTGHTKVNQPETVF